MAIRMTAKQAAALGAGTAAAPKTRRKPRDGRKQTYCAICGGYIPVSPGSGPSHGWAKNMTGWARGYEIGALAPYCHDCFMDWMRAWRDGIPQI